MRIWSFALALIAANPAMASDPFVTVTPPATGPTNVAWWTLEMTSRPTGTQVSGVTLARINAALGETGSPWCAADALGADAFASTDPAIQAEIRQTVSAGDLFAATTRMTGRPLRAVVGNFRSCAGEVAPFLLLIDEGGRAPAVAFVRAFADWTPFIAMRADGNLLIFSSCLECDHAEILSYDRRTRRFAWRAEGP